MVVIAEPIIMSSYPTTNKNTGEMVTKFISKDPVDPKANTLQHSKIEPDYLQPSTQESQASTQDALNLDKSPTEVILPVPRLYADDLKSQAIENQRQSLSSQSSSITSLSSNSILQDSDHPQSQLYTTEVIKRAKTFLEDYKSIDVDPSITLISELLTSLIKTRAEAGQFKIKSQLLSISSKDADMRYEVENELIKKQVERLKSQAENMDFLVNKISHQKQTLKKYKNEIINKNKEIIRLRASQRLQTSNGDPKRRRKSDSTSTTCQSDMLNTLGFLASQVLTEEEKNKQDRQNRISSSLKDMNEANGYSKPRLNSFKHESTSHQAQSPTQPQTNHGNETTISEYSVSN